MKFFPFHLFEKSKRNTFHFLGIWKVSRFIDHGVVQHYIIDFKRRRGIIIKSKRIKLRNSIRVFIRIINKQLKDGTERPPSFQEPCLIEVGMFLHAIFELFIYDSNEYSDAVKLIIFNFNKRAN